MTQAESGLETSTVQDGYGYGHDRDDVYGAVAARHPEAGIIVPPRSSAVASATAATAPTQRDRHLRRIAEHGRLGWQKASGYNLRALAEMVCMQTTSSV